MLESKVVARGVPFHCTADEITKFCPVRVNVNAAPPALAELGLRATMAGTGFEGGGGWMPSELPDPPPQPARNCKKATHADFPVANGFRALPVSELRRTRIR